ncbi:hemolysin family protein [Candidatus Dependentiae bacterium]|nr:hemolysin family protein [Candidatus Dependentiae bacterium]MBU4387449.1 hemolysin family protein [Candidatus Dependentiae bacterium]MCG2756027.1 hemolysin family protein [Candidatus Dependentiae bacterium]
MSILYIEIIVFFFALTFAALFAFLETAFTALRLFKVKELSVKKDKYKSLFDTWEANPQRILITILIANNFAHVLSSVLIAEIMERLFGGVGLMVGVLLATLIILIFGEIIPKTVAKANNETIFNYSLGLIFLLYKILYPVVSMLLGIANFIFAKIGKENIFKKAQDEISEKELRFLIDYSDEKGLIEAEKSEMLQNIFGLGQTLVDEIMVPRVDMILIDANTTLQQAMDLYTKSRFSRIPVYEGNEENIIGIIHQKDVFDIISTNKESKKIVKDILRPVLFVPETQKINQLLSEFLHKRMHMAIIIDEYGTISGLVTLEDVLEEIVGEIRDEHESVRSEFVPMETGGWVVDAKISLEKLSEFLGIAFDTQESNTLAGFLSEKMQHLPKKGERFVYAGYCFQVQQATPRRILQVLVFEEKQEN